MTQRHGGSNWLTETAFILRTTEGKRAYEFLRTVAESKILADLPRVIAAGCVLLFATAEKERLRDEMNKRKMAEAAERRTKRR